jgi:hypothetical protein
MHSFCERSNCSEDKPEQSSDPPCVKNVGEHAGQEKTRWSGNDAGDDRHKCESSAAYQDEKRKRFADGGRGQRQPRLVSFRLDLSGVSPNDPDKRTSEQREHYDRTGRTEQAHPCYAIEYLHLKECVARVFRESV